LDVVDHLEVVLAAFGFGGKGGTDFKGAAVSGPPTKKDGGLESAAPCKNSHYFY
jgi:hypothetical protein